VVLRWLTKAENDLKIRYPEEYIELSIDEVGELYEPAKEVKGFVVDRLKEKGYRRQITSSDIQRMFKITRQAALKELSKLVDLGVINLVGTGRGAHYIMS